MDDKMAGASDSSCNYTRGIYTSGPSTPPPNAGIVRDEKVTFQNSNSHGAQRYLGYTRKHSQKVSQLFGKEVPEEENQGIRFGG